MPNLQMELNELKTTADFQRLVDAINGLLCLDTEVEASVVSGTHQKYDQAVRLVNDRLRKCDELLQKGLRAEAIQEAQVEPTLLDLVHTLDFDEQELWNDYVQQCGFARAPELLVDVADDLETAWADAEPLADLMYRHRLHALARSPLPIRIEIMRQLARLDRDNPLWDDEIQEFEKTRLADVLEECKAAAAGEDLKRLAAIESELKSSEWRVKPSGKLVGFASAKTQEIQGKHARSELVKLEPLLNEAYSLSDVETARKLREEWGRHVAVARLSEQDPLMAKVQEPLKWLAEKDRQDREQAAYLAAVKELERALDRQDATKADFEPLYYKIEQFGRGVPDNLRERLTVRVEELDQETARRRRNKMLAIASGAVLLLALVGAGIWTYARSAEVSAHAENLKGLLADKQLDKAQEYVANLEADNPRVHGHPDIQALIREMENAVQDDKDRRSKYERHISRAENVLKELSAENPASLGTVPQGLNALKDAFEISKTEMERAKVLALRGETQTKETQVQKLVDTRFRTDVANFSQKIQSLDPDAANYGNELPRLKTEADVLQDRKWLSPGLGAQLVGPMLAEIAQLKQQHQLNQAEEIYLLSIGRAIGDHNAYREKLDDYVQDDRFAGTPRHREFQQVLKNESDLWAGFEEWRLLKQRLNGTNLAALDPKSVPNLLARANAVLEKYPGFPEQRALESIVEYLKVLALRDQGKIQSAVEDVLNRPIVRSLYFLETKDGKKYYSTKIPTALGDTHITIRYALDIALDDEEYLKVKKEDVKNSPLGASYDFESPQMKFSKFAKEKINKLATDPKTWEQDFLEILKTLEDDKKMDPFVRFQLVKAMQEFGTLGSVYLKQQLQLDTETLAKFGDQIDTNANWINPANPDAPKERQKAADALLKLQATKGALKGLPAYLESLNSIDLGPEYAWVGWLHRDRKNQWTITYETTPGTSRTSDLYVLTRTTATGPVTYTKIGELKTGATKLSQADGSPALLEGRPVYERK